MNDRPHINGMRAGNGEKIVKQTKQFGFNVNIQLLHTWYHMEYQWFIGSAKMAALSV